MVGVILAAGQGKRLRPLTARQPKPMVGVAGQPFLAHLIERFRYADVREIVLVVGYYAWRIWQYFNTGARWDVSLHYVYQLKLNGTAPATLLAEHYTGNEPFMLTWGDVVTHPEHYRKIRMRFDELNCDMLMAVNLVEDISKGASVCFTEDGRVVSVVEKPPLESAPSQWNQAGLFVAKPVLFQYLRNVPLSPRGEYEFTSAVSAMIEEGCDVRAYCIGADTWEIGTTGSLQRAERALIHMRTTFDSTMS
ncbi:MAG TPA: nucleotidyltransferase family protein [Armatimonadetes bacterium]|nr:nucleotidyltransferase family protein [Armatimonadota bacterium]